MDFEADYRFPVIKFTSFIENFMLGRVWFYSAEVSKMGGEDTRYGVPEHGFRSSLRFKVC